MELDKNKKIAIFITLAAIIVLGGITFTFFSVAVSNTNNEKVQTSTATMSLTFDDNDNGVNATLNLGQSIVKKFTLENTGTVDAYGKINWYNLVNTYTSDSLTWTLEQSTTENGTYTTVGSGKVPTSSSAVTRKLKNSLLVPVSTTYYYKLTITLNNLDINQSSDLNASMHSQFSLENGTKPGTQTIMDLVSGEPTNSINVITKAAPTGATCTNTLAYDGTSDNNLRYVGADPCNYVVFNGENPTSIKWVDREISSGTEYEIFDTENECLEFLQAEGYTESDECVQKTLTKEGWRIIGVMKNINDGTGKTETRLKILREKNLGIYSYNSSADGYGVSDWIQSKLMLELNGDYLDTTLNENTYWYNGPNNQKNAIYYYRDGLKASALALVGDAVWPTGGVKYGLTAGELYTSERNYPAYQGFSTSWTGKVALASASDYAFSTSGGQTNSRATCLNDLVVDSTSDETWYSESDCKTNTWIQGVKEQNPSPSMYLLSPTIGVQNSLLALVNSWTLYNLGTLGYNEVHPCIFLKSDVVITGGDGSPDNPYILG